MELPVTLRSSRKAHLVLFLGSLVFVAMGFLLLRWQDATAIGYLCIAFFGLCAVVSLIQLLPNSSYLRLTRDGFTVCSLFRCHSVSWREVGRFGVADIGVKRMVGWDSVQPISAIGKTSKSIGGYSSALPETYGYAAGELATLLNQLRDENTRSENI